MIEEKLPNQSKIIIQINTNFKPFLQDRVDFKVSLINDFHDAVYKWIEQKLTDTGLWGGSYRAITCAAFLDSAYRDSRKPPPAEPCQRRSTGTGPQTNTTDSRRA